jgi:type IV pilus assembly protein PilX
MKPSTVFANKERRMSQGGVSMVIVLIFIVILTSLGTYALRRVLLGANLSRNALDLQVAKQAAQSALRDGERDILSTRPALGAVCNRGIDRPMPPVPGYNFAPPTWDGNCPAGQCVVGSGKRKDTYPNSNFAANIDPQPWWPAQTPSGEPPVWNNDNTTKPSPGNSATCLTFTGGVPYGTYTGLARVPGVWRQPEYLIEGVQTGFIRYFRITARGWGLSPNSEVIQQTIVNLETK